MQCRARKEHLIVEFRMPRSDETTALIDDSGVEKLEYSKRWGRYRIKVMPGDETAHRDLSSELIRRAHGSPADIED